MKAIAGLELSAVPLGKRFDMLLKHLEDEDDSSTSETHEETTVETQSESKHPTPPQSQAEAAGIDVCDFNGLENSLFGNDKENESGNESGNASESGLEANYDDEEEMLSKLYKRAGASKPKPSKLTKPSRKSEEESARQAQKLGRSIRAEVGTHTVNPKSVDSFLRSLGELESESDDEGMIMASSPPRMQGLVSFVATKPSSNVYSDDEDLEIVPETKTNRMSQAMRDMLQFSGGGGITRSDRQLNSVKEKLQRLGVQQAAERRAELAQERDAESLAMPNFLNSDVRSDINTNDRADRVDSVDSVDGDGDNETNDADSKAGLEMPVSSLPGTPQETHDGTDEDVANETEPTILNSVVREPNQTQYVAPVDDVAALLGIEEEDEDEEENDDEEILINDKALEEGERITEIKLPSQIPHEQRLPELRKQHLHEQVSRLKQAFIEAEAVESDSSNVHSGDESPATDGELTELINDSAHTDDWKVKQKHLQNEIESDQRLLRQAAANHDGQFLSDDDLRVRTSMQKPVHTEITLKSTAFFASVEESLIMPRSRQSNSVADGLQFLRSIAENDRKGYDADLRSDDLQEHERVLPTRIPVRARTNTATRTSTIRDRTDRTIRDTYASRVSAAPKPTVEILHSLKRAKTRALDPMPAPKQAKTQSAPRLQNTNLFKRNWTT